jgi:hypothetical protein
MFSKNKEPWSVSVLDICGICSGSNNCTKATSTMTTATIDSTTGSVDNQLRSTASGNSSVLVIAIVVPVVVLVVVAVIVGFVLQRRKRNR